MSTILAVPAKGTQVFYGDTSSPPNYTVIARQSTLTGLSLSVKTEDVTAQDSGTPWRQYVPTLLDGGNLQFKMFWLATDVSQDALLTLFTTRGLTTPGNPVPFKVVFSDAAATVWLFNGFVTTYKITAPVDGVITADVTLMCTGEPTFP